MLINGLSANSLFTVHQGQSGGRGLSPRLWNKVYGQGLSPDGYANWYGLSSDFVSFGGTVATNVGTYSEGFKSYEDTGSSIGQHASFAGGAVTLTTSSTDNHEATMQAGYSAGGPFVFSSTAGRKLIYEARFRLGSVASQNYVFGLGAVGLAANDGVITDVGALASISFIGFNVLEADSTKLKFVYAKSGQTAQTVFTYSTALAASTWVKAGFIYDPLAPTSKRITAFIDNVEQSTYVTGTNMSAATFPADVYMAPVFSTKNGAASSKTVDFDWFGAAQDGNL